MYQSLTHCHNCISLFIRIFYHKLQKCWSFEENESILLRCLIMYEDRVKWQKNPYNFFLWIIVDTQYVLNTLKYFFHYIIYHFQNQSLTKSIFPDLWLILFKFQQKIKEIGTADFPQVRQLLYFLLSPFFVNLKNLLMIDEQLEKRYICK